jgi:hypothetical protein
MMGKELSTSCELMYNARNENQIKQKKNIILHFKTFVIMITF